jgi:predicted secreted protein
MKFMITFILILFFPISLSERMQSRLMQTTTYEINETKNNTILNIPYNITFEIYVDANPTTGYKLFLKNYDSLDKTQLQFSNIIMDSTAKAYMSNDYIPSKTSSEIVGVVGSGGKYKFIIKALKEISNLELIFSQMQPWDSSTETGKYSVFLTTNAKKPVLLSSTNDSKRIEHLPILLIIVIFYIFLF